jgi:hypothetical protein
MPTKKYKPEQIETPLGPMVPAEDQIEAAIKQE